MSIAKLAAVGCETGMCPWLPSSTPQQQNRDTHQKDRIGMDRIGPIGWSHHGDRRPGRALCMNGQWQTYVRK